MAKFPFRKVSVGFTALLLFAHAEGAWARAEGVSDYTKAQTYSAALRYIRVDLGYEVLEKDPEAAYVLFRYSGTGPTKSSSSGSIEIIEASGRVKFFVQLPRWPEYHERLLRDGLLKKLREEYGAAPPRVPAAPPKRDLDAGAD